MPHGQELHRERGEKRTKRRVGAERASVSPQALDRGVGVLVGP